MLVGGVGFESGSKRLRHVVHHVQSLEDRNLGCNS
jgi:hypothetical protein